MDGGAAGLMTSKAQISLGQLEMLGSWTVSSRKQREKAWELVVVCGICFYVGLNLVGERKRKSRLGVQKGDAGAARVPDNPQSADTLAKGTKARLGKGARGGKCRSFQTTEEVDRY